MFNPFFDVSSLTDKEITDKLAEVSERLMRARMVGMPQHILETMQSVINSCHEELYCRSERRELEKMQGVSCVFDVEEDYLNKKEEKNESTGKQNYRPGW